MRLVVIQLEDGLRGKTRKTGESIRRDLEELEVSKELAKERNTCKTFIKTFLSHGTQKPDDDDDDDDDNDDDDDDDDDDDEISRNEMIAREKWHNEALNIDAARLVADTQMRQDLGRRIGRTF